MGPNTAAAALSAIWITAGPGSAVRTAPTTMSAPACRAIEAAAKAALTALTALGNTGFPCRTPLIKGLENRVADSVHIAAKGWPAPPAGPAGTRVAAVAGQTAQAGQGRRADIARISSCTALAIGIYVSLASQNRSAHPPVASPAALAAPAAFTAVAANTAPAAYAALAPVAAKGTIPAHIRLGAGNPQFTAQNGNAAAIGPAAQPADTTISPMPSLFAIAGVAASTGTAAIAAIATLARLGPATVTATAATAAMASEAANTAVAAIPAITAMTTAGPLAAIAPLGEIPSNMGIHQKDTPAGNGNPPAIRRKAISAVLLARTAVSTGNTVGSR